jgi:hypothetical protein
MKVQLAWQVANDWIETTIPENQKKLLRSKRRSLDLQFE